MDEDDPVYRERIRQEADFWDARASALLASGRLPLWFDHRRGQDVTFLPLDQLKGAGLRSSPALYRTVYGEMFDSVIKTACQKKGNALDVGCGAGWLSLEMARCGMHVDGFDISPQQIAVARRISQESQKSSDPLLHGDFGSTNYRVADLNWTTLEPDKYDVVVSFGTLHHIQRLEHLLTEIKKSLRPGGRLIFYEDVGYHGLSRLFPMMFRVAGLPARLARWLKPPGCCSFPTSPFEGISAARILDLVRRDFALDSIRFHFLFLPVLVSRLRIYRLRPEFSLPLTKLLNGIDESLNRTGILRGSFVLAFARKVNKGENARP